MDYPGGTGQVTRNQDAETERHEQSNRDFYCTAKPSEVEIGQCYQVHPVQGFGVPYRDDNEAQSQPQRELESSPEPAGIHAAGIAQGGVGIQRLGKQHGAYQE